MLDMIDLSSEIRFRAPSNLIAFGSLERMSRLVSASIVGAIVLLASLACGGSQAVIIFSSDRDGNLEIYSSVISSGTEVNLTNSSTDEFDPVLSPNRRFVSFLSGEEGNTAVEVMRVDGTERGRITQSGADHSGHRWSPSNDRIAFARRSGSQSNIYMAGIDGSKLALLTSIEGHDVGDWSGNGDSVAFVVEGGEKQGIYVRNPDGVNEFQRTMNPDYSPIWSPDSRWLAFLSTRDGNPEIYVMDSDGNNLLRVTETDSDE
ncbi:MAG: hypothetical protein QGI88_10340, partial [SAR202 cluster bacterium]|nr:hypothetical protein [SAR202 cluster bacterium]